MIIDIKEVLRYLGYKNQVISEGTRETIEECIRETQEIARENFIYRYYDIEKLDNEIALTNTNVNLKGKDIYKHLLNSQSCAIMAVTLGSAVDFKIRYYEKVDLTKALIMDACATAAVESLCDEVEGLISKEAAERDLGITYRYSPGYGDLSIELQPELINLLEAHKKINLTASENYILLPRKSVTAIIGLQDKRFTREHPGCGACNNFESCSFRKGVNYCGI